jgi:hypothetical protein
LFFSAFQIQILFFVEIFLSGADIFNGAKSCSRLTSLFEEASSAPTILVLLIVARWNIDHLFTRSYYSGFADRSSPILFIVFFVSRLFALIIYFSI